MQNVDIKAPRRPEHRRMWRRLDLTRREDVVSAIAEFRPAYVYHLGARTDLGSTTSWTTRRTRSGRSTCWMPALKSASVRRVVFASSRLVCRIGYQPASDDDYCPTTAYGESKVQGEQIVRDHAQLPFEWVIVRPTSIWGPWFDVPYRQFFDSIRRGRFVHPRHTKTLKSFGYVGNSIFQLQTLMTAPSAEVSGKTFYVGDYEADRSGSVCQEHRSGVRSQASDLRPAVAVVDCSSLSETPWRGWGGAECP